MFILITCIILSWQSLIRSIKFNRLITASDTRNISKNWVEKTIPAGSTILVDTTMKPEYPATLNTPLLLDISSIGQRMQEARTRGIESAYLQMLTQANQDQVGYHIIATSRVDSLLNIFTDEASPVEDVGVYYNQNIEYLIVSSWLHKQKMKQGFIESLNEYYQLTREFVPDPVFAEDPHFIRMDYQVLDRVNIFSSDLVFGPVIKIYKMKTSI